MEGADVERLNMSVKIFDLASLRDFGRFAKVLGAGWPPPLPKKNKNKEKEEKAKSSARLTEKQ